MEYNFINILEMIILIIYLMKRKYKSIEMYNINLVQEISRIYDHQEEAIELKDKVRKIITYKLEDMRRNTVINNLIIKA